MYKARTQTASSVPSLPQFAFLAKTYTTADGVYPGRTVEDHCHIVGKIAKALIERYPIGLQQSLFPPGAELAAACHDIGKISPTFYEKIRQACTQKIPPRLDKAIDPQLERNWGGHAGVSQATAKALAAPKYVSEILGMHHGFSPQLAGKTATAEFFGGSLWQEQRVLLVEHLKKVLNTSWPEMNDEAQARIVAGLTSVADWIGSGSHFEDPANSWDLQSIERAVLESGFVVPTYKKHLQFEDVFEFSPHPAQNALIQTASMPGVYILEAPMGMGKTEAALYAAYNMLHKGLATGIYFALPTQLTSNKIYERFNAFLERILEKDCPHRHALLLHGGAWLVQTEMGEEGRPGGSWFEQSKRGLLAPFAVGTVDQALMAAMRVKHGFVRAFGLAGKVVILDEVHTYDAYTGTLLDALVKLLRSMQCTVVILSATLNHTRRAMLIEQSSPTSAYPLITASNAEHVVQEVFVPPEKNVNVLLKTCCSEDDALDEALLRATQGQQVLWLENTVDGAQEKYRILAARAAEMAVECGLLHSRFTATQRSVNEAKWVHAFGKEGWATRSEQGRILVGTQVLEQSLDIDADFLISRFAPTDMLFQRLGRLWRHAQTPRSNQAVREAWFLAPPLSQAIEDPRLAFGKSAFVYAPYVLCRSLHVWQGKTHVSLPGDIRSFIDATYIEQKDSGPMAVWCAELEEGTKFRRGRKQLQKLAQMGLAGGENEDEKTLPEEQAQTRYSDMDTSNVLLVRALEYEPQKSITRLTLLDGQSLDLPHRKSGLDKTEWKLLTKQLMENMVSVNALIAPKPLTMSHAKALGFGHCFYLGEPLTSSAQDLSMLRVATVNVDYRIQDVEKGQSHDKHNLFYRDDLGYYIKLI